MTTTGGRRSWIEALPVGVLFFLLGSCEEGRHTTDSNDDPILLELTNRHRAQPDANIIGANRFGIATDALACFTG
jgi:hypothetical protein